jgi:uncharacterized SAM-binding protein YcdF (DUF218 family)
MSWAALVVLGARVAKDGRPSDALRHRAATAAALYHQGAAPRLLLCGGAIGGAPPEAEVALGVVTALGVPEAACILESRSRNTWENAQFAAPLLRAHAPGRALVVTDRHHLFRALRCFWAQGVAADGAPSLRDGVPFVPRRRRAAWAREAAALVRRPRLLWVRPVR